MEKEGQPFEIHMHNISKEKEQEKDREAMRLLGGKKN